MVDPVNVTDYKRTTDQLEEFCLFVLAVAGKNATRTAINLENLLNYGKEKYPFCGTSPMAIVRTIDDEESLPLRMKSLGFGCYNIKARGMVELAWREMDLRTCTVDDLENIHGIGMKSARYFILHSRKNARVACLDTHVLKWLSYYTGYDVPKSTPGRKKYLELEKLFLKLATLMKTSPAKLDLAIWNKQRGSDEESLASTSKSKNRKVLDRRVQ